MGAEFGVDACETQIVLETFGQKDALMNEVENQIEYQLKSYLSVTDSEYNTLINPNHNTCSFDAKLLQKLITKSKSTQIFTFRLIHQIFAERFKIRYQDPFESKETIINDDKLTIKNNKFIIQQTDKTPKERKSQKLAWTQVNQQQKSLFVMPTNQRELIASIESAIHFGYKINVLSKSKPMDCNKYDINDKVLNIDLKKLNKASMPIDIDILNVDGKSICNLQNMVIVETGSTPKQIHSILWPKHKRDRLKDSNDGYFKVLPCVYDHQFDDMLINNIISNGLQSSISTPFNNNSLIHYVKSFQMIIIDKIKYCRIVQIEPSVGCGAIHDVNKWNNKYPNIELIQDNDIFESCLSGMGLFGIIYSYHLMVQDAYFLKKNVYLTNWNDFKENKWKNIQKECECGNILGLSLMISPYTTFDNKYIMSPPITICTFKKTKIRNPNNLRSHCNVDGLKKRGKYPSLLNRNNAIMIWISKVFPELIPFMIQMMFQQSRITLQQEIENDTNQEINDTQFIYNQFGLMFDNFIDAIDDYIKLCNNLKKTQQNKQYVTAPFIVTFGKRSIGHLNFNAKHKWNVFIKQPMCHFEDNTENKNETKLMTPYLYDLLTTSQSLFKKYHSSINLSYYIDENKVNLLETVDKNKFKKFVNCYSIFNASQIFCNSFTAKYGLDKMTECHDRRKKRDSQELPNNIRVFGNGHGSAQILSR